MQELTTTTKTLRFGWGSRLHCLQEIGRNHSWDRTTASLHCDHKL